MAHVIECGASDPGGAKVGGAPLVAFAAGEKVLAWPLGSAAQARRGRSFRRGGGRPGTRTTPTPDSLEDLTGVVEELSDKARTPSNEDLRSMLRRIRHVR
jgi:hypothetical protein